METASLGDDKMIPRERAATSKSRVDKSRQPVVATSHADVVSGLLPQDEWLSLLEAEQGDSAVGDILAELLDRVMDGCLKADVAQQLVPFVVAQARDAILHIAQWRFLARDEGDSDLKDADGTWQEDEEPEPLTTDSWAQGCVPIQRARLSPGEGEVSGAQTLWQQEKQDPPVVAETEAHPVSPQHSIQVPNTSATLPVQGPSHPQGLPDKVAIAPRSPEGKPPRALSLLPQPAPRPRRPARPPDPCPSPGQPEQGWHPLWSPHRDAEAWQGARSHRSRSLARGRSQVSPLPSPSRASLTTMWPRPKQKGANTTPGVPRLGFQRRPEHWIWPQVEVLDPKDKLLAHPYGALWHRRGSERGSSRLPQGSVPTRGTQLQVRPPGSPQPIGHLPQPLGSVRLAPGVTLRWDTGVKQEVEEDEKEEETEQSLRPIHPTVLLPAMAARQATGESKY
ncbi:uncharacterized protein C2orf81 homolog [Melanerpes formicivorus]|uniref:uncharacterized protein C2orf81 homolog n=1 Tax=Melanerpes formicivorus TaxID=211600 RepID=UPI00358E7901